MVAHYKRGRARFGYDQDAPAVAIFNLVGELFFAERLDEATTVLLSDPDPLNRRVGHE